MPATISVNKVIATAFLRDPMSDVVSQRSTRYLLILLGLSILVGVLSHRAILDDGFIYLVVSRNIVAGEGWRFNVNEAIVNPCTSPLYPLLLVALQWIALPPIAATLVLYSLGTWAASAGLYLLYRERSRTVAGILSLYYLVHPMFFRSIGLETSLFISTIIWTALFWGAARYRSAAVCACAASLLRIDGVLLLAILPALSLRHERIETVVKKSFVFALPLIGWCLFSYLSFGHLLPQSVQVKALQAKFGFWQQQGPWIIALLSSPAFPGSTWLLAALCLFVSRKKIPTAQRVIYLICGCQVLVYGCAGAPAGYPWYFAPACLIVDILLCEGFVLLERGDLSIGRHRLVLSVDNVWAKSCRAVALLGALTASAVIPVVAPVSYRHATDYKEVADWVNKRTHQKPLTIATVEIGYLGYLVRGAIRDVHGLIHPAALPSLKQGDFTWWYGEPHPDYIVAHSPRRWDGEPSPRWPSDKYEDFRTRYHEAFTTSSGSVKVYALQHGSPSDLPSTRERP